MRESRNPFRLRRSENIDTDTDFLTLFEPGILDILAEKGLPETVQPIRSAAGGGKTSLLRLFTPDVLHKLYSRRADDKVKELYQRVQTLGALDERGPTLLGVMLLCGRNYSALQKMNLDQGQHDRLFFGLLNARIVLAAFRNALVLKGFEFPKDLSRLYIDPRSNSAFPSDLDLPCSGQELYDWARGIEKTICSELDSFGPLRTNALLGHDSLFALSIIEPEALTIDSQRVAERMVLMMDDIQMLTDQQRNMLIQRVIEARSRVGVWIAERFEALNTQEMLTSGSMAGRDHETPIEVESFWRKRHQRFEKHVMGIADRRVRASTETEWDTFRSCFEDNLDGPEWDDVFCRAIREVEDRVRNRVSHTEQFQDWLDTRERLEGTPRERAISWRVLEILIERELNRPQKGLFDEIEPRHEGELQKKDDSSVKQAAELFLAKEYKLPYYFGAERIARLASLNIQQFLGLAGNLFEEVIAIELLKGRTEVLSARRQHDLMKVAAKAIWDDIPNSVRHGRDLRRFLESVGGFCRWYTYRPTAPNDPGVGGTGIRMSERTALLDKKLLKARPDRKRFADLLASALAHNYLVADLDYKCKGDLWMVLNLNRMLCVHFDLPLGYGLYKERPLNEMCRWIDQPFVEPQQEELFV